MIHIKTNRRGGACSTRNLSFIEITDGLESEMKKNVVSDPAIIDVQPLDGYRLLLTFDNREKRVFDVSPYLNLGKFSELKDIKIFNSVKVKFDSIEWGNQLDLDPELLYKNSLECEDGDFRKRSVDNG